MTETYVYLHSRPGYSDHSGVFYVGIGTKDRALSLRPSLRNVYHRNIVSKYGSDSIQISLIPCSSRKVAAVTEIALIAMLKEQGCKLANLSLGGESGSYGIKRSAETRKKLSESVKAAYAADSTISERSSASNRKTWSDPEKRKALSITRKLSGCVNEKIANGSESKRKDQSNAISEKWNDFDCRNKVCEGVTKAWESEELRQKQRENMVGRKWMHNAETGETLRVPVKEVCAFEEKGFTLGRSKRIRKDNLS